MLRGCILIACCLLLAAPAPAQVPALITRGIEVHELDRQEAAKKLPVKLTGVVTFPGASLTAGFILDDGTRGVFVDRIRPPGAEPQPDQSPWYPLKTGMKIEVTGVTDSGSFAPQVIAREMRVLGTAPLPPETVVTLSELLTGRFDCQRVALRGIVQDAGPRRWFYRFSLARPEGRCEVVASRDQESLAPIIDAEVIVHGVCFSFFNPRGELAGVRIQISGSHEIEVIKPAPVDPFAVPELDLGRLRMFSLEDPPLHRRVTRGTVTLCRPGEFFYIQSGDRGVRVQTQQPDALEPGTEVVVSGFVEMQRHYAEIREAIFRKTRSSAVPPALPVDRAKVLGVFDGYRIRGAEDVDGRLVSMTGQLIQMEKADEGSRLYLQSEGAVISADLGADTPLESLSGLRMGSQVQLTGVCRADLSSAWPAQDIPQVVGYRMLLRNRDDIRILRLASWWTAERLWKVLAGLFAVFVCALVWALFLRRKVEQERRAREEEERQREAADVEFTATMRERERLAADLHDTLEQALTGVAFQLETMNRLRNQLPDRSLRHLAMARQILAGSREDVRRSVWNLRANVLEGRMLREALEFIAYGLVEGQEIEVTTGGAGEEEVLPDLIAGNLLMLAKEGITNALKHAKPTLIHLTVDYEPGRVTLTVEDNGCGFDPDKAQGPHQGHFGLQGMRERATRLGGQLDIASAPGKGTRIVIRVDPGF